MHTKLIKETATKYKDTATHVNISPLPSESTVAVQCENGEQRTHGIIIGHSPEEYNN